MGESPDAMMKWVNNSIDDPSYVIKNLSEDFKDGVIVIKLLEKLSKQPFPEKYSQKPTNPFIMTQNCNSAVDFARRIPKFNYQIDGNDISSGNEKKIIDFLNALKKINPNEFTPVVVAPLQPSIKRGFSTPSKSVEVNLPNTSSQQLSLKINSFTNRQNHCQFSQDDENKMISQKSLVVVSEGFDTNSVPGSKFVLLLANNIKEFPISAFYGMDNWFGIELKVSIPKLPEKCFSMCKKVQSIVLPNTVTDIGLHCFSGCSFLRNIDLPNSVTSMEDFCSESCSSLQAIRIPTNVKKLGNNCFSKCSALRKVDLSSSLISLGDLCFESCSQLYSINLPKTTEKLGKSCFAGCSSLDKIEFPVTVTSLGESCFANCRMLKMVELPKWLDNMGMNCFQNCTQLVNVKVPPRYVRKMKGIPEETTIPITKVLLFDEIKSNYFNGCPGHIHINIDIK
uniref:Leucine rich repeat protein n=1 Tax=Coptotermes formosanus TaxID=36987 RepID=R4V1B5_COPFO|nr:leucine rich repeat protein [Coptotermes formosanus]